MSIARRGFLASGASALGTVAIGRSAHAAAIQLKVADSFPPSHNIPNHGTRWWMSRVEELSKGAVKFQYFGAEQIGKLKDMLSLAQRGVADIAYVPPTFNEGRMPLSTVHNMPNLFESSYVGSLAFYETMLNTRILQEDYLRNGIRPLWGVMTSPYNVFTRSKPIRRVADLQGMKLKTAGSYQNDIARLLGAVPVDIPSPETYQAMQLGTVDGAIFPTSAAASYRMDEVARHYTVGFNVTVFYAPYVMATRSWDRLPPDVKQAFETANREVNVRMSKHYDDIDRDLVERYRKAGVEILELAPEERQEVNRRLAPMFDTWVKDMEGKKLPGAETLAYYRQAIAAVRA